MKTELLKNIAEIIAGQSPPSNTYNKSGDGIPFFQGMADYGERSPIIRNWCRQPIKISFPNDILISVRAPVGPVNINNVEACIGRGLSAIRARKEYSSEYIFYFLKANEKQIAKLGVGSTFTAITQKDLGNLNILIPETLAEQIKIATVLSKAEALIKQRKENIGLLEEFLKSIFLKMFGTPIKMKDYKLENLGSYIKFLTSGSRGWAKHYSNSGAKFLRIQNIWKGNFRLDDMQLINVPDTQEAIRTKVQEGDLLLTITADLGRTAVVPKNFGDAFINQHLVLIRLDERINPMYAAYFFFMPFGYSVIQRKNKSAVKAGLNFNDINSFEIFVPPIELQNKFVVIVEKTEALKQQLISGLNELENLYASLSQKAFKGDLEINTQKIIDSIEEELTSMEYGESIGAQGLSNSTDEFEALLWRKQLEAHKNDIIQKELIISILKGDIAEISTPDKTSQKEVKTKNKTRKPKKEEHKKHGDPFEVDEVTAKKQGAKFYNEWKKLHSPKVKSKITWDKVSSQQVAEWIKEKYEGYHFSNEMLIRFLMDEYVVFPDYYSSEELKKYPQLNGADDIKSFIFSAVSNENPFIKLEQHFYNAEKETFQLNVTAEDNELIESREAKERSGIYFSIVEQ